MMRLSEEAVAWSRSAEESTGRAKRFCSASPSPLVPLRARFLSLFAVRPGRPVRGTSPGLGHQMTRWEESGGAEDRRRGM